MTSLFSFLLSITLIFIGALVAKEFMKKGKKLCAICVAVSLTWMIFLVMALMGKVENDVALGLLMGQSITGVYYLAEKKVRKEMTVWRLPFIMTLTILAYMVLAGAFPGNAVLLVGVLWIIGGLLYMYRENPKINKTVKKLVECCRRW